MIQTLLLTIILESLVVLGYCKWRRKPLGPVLGTSLCANLVTQLFLWGMLTTFYHSYMAVLFLVESLIWFVEVLLLYFVRANRLNMREAVFLGTAANLLSLGLGWFLPI